LTHPPPSSSSSNPVDLFSSTSSLQTPSLIFSPPSYSIIFAFVAHYFSTLNPFRTLIKLHPQSPPTPAPAFSFVVPWPAIGHSFKDHQHIPHSDQRSTAIINMSYYYGSQPHQPLPSSHSASTHSHHGGRSRRAPRLSNSQNSHRQFRGVRSMKDLSESPPVSAFRLRFEAGRSFDLDDDLEFCPGLLTEDDVSISGLPWLLQGVKIFLGRHGTDSTQLQSIHSSSSDGSSSTGSPETSPLQQQIQPSQQVTPTFSLPSMSNSSHNFATGFVSNNSHPMKIHQPSALRTRNAIPIVNPSTGMRVTSPPSSISPAMMQQQTYARRW